MEKKNYKICDIDSVECVGEYQDDYVYDIEMADDTDHTFFANNILVHNSVYATLSHLLKSLDEPFSTGNIPSEKTFQIAEELQEYINDNITKWAKNTLNSKDPRFVFKREALCNSGIFLEPKKYILHVLDYEGVPMDKIKYTGVEVVSIRIPRSIKPYIKNVSEVMLREKDYTKTNKATRELYDKFISSPTEEIGKIVKVNTFRKYASRANGLNFVKGTPGPIRAGIAYNYLIDTLDLGNVYQKIDDGSYIKLIHLEPNKYNIKVIGFIDKLPEEFGLIPDKTRTFNNDIFPSIQRIYDAVGWRTMNPSSECAVDLFQLLS